MDQVLKHKCKSSEREHRRKYLGPSTKWCSSV